MEMENNKYLGEGDGGGKGINKVFEEFKISIQIGIEGDDD